ncbi:helix-turn-helix domain-containing protein [Cystobacter fuscus]|uniref:helix-turn-helix domain-containing protein n=1 Tax=Cystobacter fuscus TaxID=43 RepID=UPI001E5E9F92|nr:helix-turn-helix domain-containing protein [Cystobacter fuscus]
MADPATLVSELADRLELDRRTIWALCRRFDELGVDVVMDAPRSGRPRELSPPSSASGWCGWRAVSRPESGCT